MDELLAEQAAAERAMQKRKAELAQDDEILAARRTKTIKLLGLREEERRLEGIQKDTERRLVAVASDRKKLEEEVFGIEAHGLTDVIAPSLQSARSELTDVRSTACQSAENTLLGGTIPERDDRRGRNGSDDSFISAYPDSLSEDEITTSSSSKRFKSALSKPKHQQAPNTPRRLPGNMVTLQGDAHQTIWAICCARPECRTNMAKHGELLKGVDGVCRHARNSHYADWKLVFENQKDRTRKFGENPLWCEWYRFTDGEYERWVESGTLPFSAEPRGVASPFRESKPPEYACMRR